MVNYERAPFDKENPLQVRLVNQILANVQRKATFVDTLLRSPRVTLYTSRFGADELHIAIFCILHPAYPIFCGAYVDPEPGSVDTPPTEWTPSPAFMTSKVYSTFDWRSSQLINLEFRQSEIDAVDSYGPFRRYIANQYRGIKGEDQLLPVGSIIGTNLDAYADINAIILWSELGNERPESEYTVDDLWCNFQYLLGRNIETLPVSDFEFYTPPEADNVEVDVGEEETLSQTTWPRLDGYSTQYIDNLGIFVPTGYTINPIITQQVLRELENVGNVYGIARRMVVLEKASPANNLQETQNLYALQSFQQVPVVGSFLGIAEWAWKGDVPRKWWVRAYAFGRQEEPVPTPNEVRKVQDFYYSAFQSKWKGPVIRKCDEVEVSRLCKMLVEKRYIKPEDVRSWL